MKIMIRKRPAFKAIKQIQNKIMIRHSKVQILSLLRHIIFYPKLLLFVFPYQFQQNPKIVLKFFYLKTNKKIFFFDGAVNSPFSDMWCM